MAVGGEAGGEGLEGVDAVGGEHLVKVGIHAEGHRGRLVRGDRVVLVGDARGELLRGEVEGPVHRGEEGAGGRGVLHIHIHIQIQRHALGGDGGDELDDVGGGDVTIGDVLHVHAGDGDVGDVLEGVFTIDEIGDAGYVFGQIVQECARADKKATCKNDRQ